MLESTTLERRGLAKGLKGFLDVLFLLALLASFFILIVWPLACFAGHDVYEITVPVGIDEIAISPPNGVGGLTLDEAKGELRFSPEGFVPSALFWLLTAGFSGALIYGLILVRKILATAADGFPFHPDNPRRLNHLGWIVLATALVATISEFSFGWWALSLIQNSDLPIHASFEIHGEGIFSGLLALVLASIWKQAVQMAEDQSLTV